MTTATILDVAGSVCMVMGAIGAIGFVLLVILFVASEVEHRKRDRRPGYLDEPITFRRFDEKSTLSPRWTSLDDARRAAWERRSRT